MKKYDYLIVGAGLYGAVFACEMGKAGKRCLVIDKRNHIGGNVYTEETEGINVHKYGPHIFHTSNKRVWDYVNSLASFNHFVNMPVAYNNGRIYNLPFNMNTFYQLWGTYKPEDALARIEEQRAEYSHIKNPKNLEEQALLLCGKDIYEKLIKGYTEKQWGRPASQIPAFIIKRIPFRFTYNNNYFNDTYQGIPVGGYTQIFNKLLKHVDVMTNTNYFESKYELDLLAKKIVYTGKIDEYFEFKFGKLDYRSLHFETKTLNVPNYQGNAIVNYTEKEVPYTRIVEHKHFEFGNGEKTVITKEFPDEFSLNNEPYYPINNTENQNKLEKYQELAKCEKKILFGGRLGEYKYYDMHQVIEGSLNVVSQELNKM